jgi:Xaa-Pro aminopeptidase
MSQVIFSFPLEEYQNRRAKFAQHMANNSVALFSANSEITRSNDTEYPFCQNKNFLYLTGFQEPEASLVMVKNHQGKLTTILFCRDKDPLAEIWHGRRAGAEKAKQLTGVDECYVNAEFSEKIESLLAGREECWLPLSDNKPFENQILAIIHQIKAKAKTGAKAPKMIVDSLPVLAELRLIKSPAEIAVMQRVNDISSRAHERAMKAVKAGLYEFQLEAEIQHEFAINGARHVAYGSIVAGGDNANILHYTQNDMPFNSGDLVLIDAGGELSGYAADITRTFPVNGRFSQAQAALYNLVLTAQNEVISAIKPGQTFAYLNEIAQRVLTQGLIELGILSGDLNELVKNKACKKYFIHGLGHWLGLDVHDVGDYQIQPEQGQLRAFEPGMVLTIEPGLYFPQDDESVAPEYRGIGIRIEDNIVVTETGYHNLTTAAKTIEAIEQLMNQQ